ncbi:MAG: ABC transporter permease, partial [Candidatus Thermoplasmatota archaeon]|nr:ABC transporter permease [Candidatus Thermoplasmatota archaeon]
MFLISDPRKHPLRSFLLTVAIASSISLFLTLSSLSVGIRESSREAVENVGADIYVVPESLNPILVDLQSFDQGWAIIKELFSASSVPVSHSPRLKDTIFYFGNEGEKDETLVYGVVPGNEQEFDQFKIVKGSWFGTSADPLRDEYLSTGKINGSRITREVLVSEEFHRRSGLGPGDVIFLSTRMETEEPYSYVIQG